MICSTPPISSYLPTDSCSSQEQQRISVPVQQASLRMWNPLPCSAPVPPPSHLQTQGSSTACPPSTLIIQVWGKKWLTDCNAWALASAEGRRRLAAERLPSLNGEPGLFPNTPSQEAPPKSSSVMILGGANSFWGWAGGFLHKFLHGQGARQSSKAPLRSSELTCSLHLFLFGSL